MKQSLVAEILDHLLICGSSMVIRSLFVPYGQSLGRSIREVERQAAECPHDFSLRSRETISVTLSGLKRKGFVTRRGPKRKTVWKITAMGKRHFESAQGVDRFVLPPEDGKMRLVIFDIPEDERGKRNWLRVRLLSCDYAPLQKSVWMGKRPLPKELLKDLKSTGIIRFVHVVGLDETSDIS